MVGTGAVQVRPWQPGDAALLLASEADFSMATLTARFFTGTSRVPPAYLRLVTQAPADRWGAVVAVSLDGRLVGWADYGRFAAGGPAADIGVAVADRWQRQGWGATLLRALMAEAAGAGVDRLHAEVQLSNRGARAAMDRLLGPDDTVHTAAGVRSYTFATAAALARLAVA